MSECTAIVRMAVCGSGVGCFVMAPIANFLLGEEHKMNEFYKVVQLNFTPEIEVLYMLFERSLSIRAQFLLPQREEG